MNKKIIIGVAIVVLLGLGAWVIMRSKDKDDTNLKDTQSTTETKTEASTKPSNLKSLMSGGGNQRCTFTNTTAQGSSSGEVFVQNKNFRGDFNTIANNQTIASHMISKDDYIYSWTDGSTSGFKMKATENQTQSNQQSGSVDPNQNYDFKCSSWSPTASSFDLPVGVTFTEFTVPTLPPPTSINNSNGQPVMPDDVCNQLTEPARTQCKASLEQ